MLFSSVSSGETILLKHTNLIDGSAGAIVKDIDLLIRDGKIASIGKNLPSADKIMDCTGKYIVPAFVSAHVHVGTLKGKQTVATNYTRENILHQLEKYQRYGILQVLSMGTDHQLLFQHHLIDSLQSGLLPGANLYSAGYGFAAAGGAPGPAFPMDKLFRPSSADAVALQVDTLAKMGIKFVKIWVDDFGGTGPKLAPTIYQSIIREAHRHGMKVVAHVYYLEDARRLVAVGVDVLGHSIRDSLIDASLLQEMSSRKVSYIPTLTLDVFSVAYASEPAWMKDSFFIQSLEPGVYDMIKSDSFRQAVTKGSGFERNKKGLTIAMQNLKLMAAAGIRICLGTDSGAIPIRAQGFAEHLEMELMVTAGMKPAAVIRAATIDASALLGSSASTGSISVGKRADLLILSQNPLDDIRNTRKIETVFKNGLPARISESSN